MMNLESKLLKVIDVRCDKRKGMLQLLAYNHISSSATACGHAGFRHYPVR
jgi:hypothetical protein